MSTADDPRSGKLVARTCTEVILDHSRSGGPDDAADGLKPLSAFRSKQAYVLLGDPGAGKTTELERECEAMGDAAELLSARDFITLHIDSHPEWQGKTLFIDGLDEVRAGQADARAPLDEIRGRLDQLGRPRFRVSCREADWIGGNDWRSLKKVSPDSEMAVLRLDPLDDRAACEMLSELANSGGTNTGDVNADRASSDDEHAKRFELEEFVEQARLRGVGSMLKNPLTLRLLFEAVALTGEDEWPDSRLETFERACHLMAEDRNYEHRAASAAIGARRLPPEALMIAAGLLCAVLLLCDIEGYKRASDVAAGSTEPSNAAGPVPLEVLADAALGGGEGVGLLRSVRASMGLLSAPGGGGDLAVLEHALASKLFTAAGEGVFVPRHRQIAEFLAGRYLAERIADSGSGLPSAGRVVALMSSPSDGGVPTPLRGLSAWLATHSARARRQLIKIDPVGVGLYGDIGAFTTSEKKHLLESLGAFAERGPLASRRRHSGRGSRYSGDTARAFRSLASADMAPAIERPLNRRYATASEERFLEFLLRVLSEAEDSELGSLAGLAPATLEVLGDSESSPSVRSAALTAYIRTAPDGAGKVRELKQLLEDVHEGELPDSQGEMRRILLCCLYPHEVTPSQVWRYAIFQNCNPLSGQFWKFLCYDILELSDDSQVRELLATLHEQVRRPASTPADGPEFREGQKPDAVEQQRSAFLDPAGLNLFDLPVKLLERMLSTFGDDLDPLLLHDWLNTVRTVSRVSMKGTEALLRNIRVWFEDRPRVQKKIYRTWLEHSREDNSSGRFEHSPYAWRFEHDPYDAMHGSRPSAGLGLWCLKKAVEVLDEDIGTAMTLLEAAHKSLEIISPTSGGESSHPPLFEGAPESLEVVCRRGDGEPFRAALLEGISRPIDELSVQEQFTASQIANRYSHGREVLAWQLEKLAEAREAGEFPHARQDDQRLEQREEQTTDRQERAETGAGRRADGVVEWLECRIAATEGEEKQKLIGMLRDHEERVERAEQKKQQTTKGWAELVRSQETELCENRFDPQNLHNLARAYFNLFHDLDREASPRERISGLIGGDADLVDAAMTGLRHAVERDDLPEVDEVIACHNQSREPWLACPVLASLHLLSKDEEGCARLDGLSAAQKRKALAIHYFFSSYVFQPFGDASAARPSGVWYRRLSEKEPGLALDVLHRFASSGIRAGLEHPAGLQDLAYLQRLSERRTAADKTAGDTDEPGSRAVGHDDANISAKVHDVRLKLIEAYPARARNDQMESLDSLIAAVLRHIDRGHADTARLSSLARRKLALKSTTPAQRVRWLAVDVLASPHPRLQKLQDLAAYVNGNEIRVRHLAQFHCNTMKYDYPALSFLSDCRDPAVLRITIAMLGRSFSPLLMNGAVTPPMEMSDILSKSIHLLGSLTSGEAHEALTELIEGPELERWHSRLVRAREDQLVLYRDAAYRHPDIRQVQAALSDQAPATAADLAALLADRLSDIAEYLQGDSSNPWKQFWNVDSHGRPLRPRPEESCRDALLGELSKAGLPNGVAVAPEGYYAANTRADIKASFNGFNVPIEIKKNSHPCLWDSIHKQLIGQYTTDPATSGHGIFVVLWFGEPKQGQQQDGEQRNHWKTAKPPDGERPHTPEELKRRLTGTLTADEARKITVVVLDVTKPGAQSDQRVAV